jgi:hypothetical protein
LNTGAVFFVLAKVFTTGHVSSETSESSDQVLKKITKQPMTTKVTRAALFCDIQFQFFLSFYVRFLSAFQVQAATKYELISSLHARIAWWIYGGSGGGSFGVFVNSKSCSPEVYSVSALPLNKSEALVPVQLLLYIAMR